MSSTIESDSRDSAGGAASQDMMQAMPQASLGTWRWVIDLAKMANIGQLSS